MKSTYNQTQTIERRTRGLSVKTGIKAGPIEIRELTIRVPSGR